MPRASQLTTPIWGTTILEAVEKIPSKDRGLSRHQMGAPEGGSLATSAFSCYVKLRSYPSMTTMGRFLPFAAFWADSPQCSTMLQCDRRESARKSQSPNLVERPAAH